MARSRPIAIKIPDRTSRPPLNCNSGLGAGISTNCVTSELKPARCFSSASHEKVGFALCCALMGTHVVRALVYIILLRHSEKGRWFYALDHIACVLIYPFGLPASRLKVRVTPGIRCVEKTHKAHCGLPWTAPGRPIQDPSQEPLYASPQIVSRFSTTYFIRVAQNHIADILALKRAALWFSRTQQKFRMSLCAGANYVFPDVLIDELRQPLYTRRVGS